MITLKKLADWQPQTKENSSRIFLYGQKTVAEAAADGGAATVWPEALRGVFAAGLLLDLKPGHFDFIRQADGEHLRTDFFFCLPDDTNAVKLSELCASLLGRLKKHKLESAEILLADDVPQEQSALFYKRLLLDRGHFDQYKSSGIKPVKAQEAQADEDEKTAAELEYTIYLPANLDFDQENGRLNEAAVLTDAILTARRLVNEPANVMTPFRLAEEAAQLAAQHGFSIEVFDEKAIRKMGLEAFWSVAKGSDQPPRFLVMRWLNNPESEELLALVGKGLTYDSGGYAIKPASGMLTMHADMGGSAAVIGAISALAAVGAKVNVVGVVAACENMVSGHSYRNGDIIPSLSGKFIEIVNTDAEGRVTLADAICYADRVLNASKIIDIATLTGSVQIALGNEISGVLADDEAIWQALQAASEVSGDKIWRLPCDEGLAKQNKSTRADIKNSGGRPGGSATAGLFCRAFAGGKPWGHLDIAATAYREKADALGPEGATGVGVELLYRTARSLFGGK